MAKNGKENSGLSSGMNKAQNLMERMLKNSKVESVERLLDSSILKEKNPVSTKVLGLNVALSGKVDGGFLPGLTIFAGPSRHYKSSMVLILAAAYLNKYEDGIIYYYNNEFGIKKSYLESYGVDVRRVIHCPIENLEKMRSDMAAQLDAIEDGDHVMFICDSISNIASSKEILDSVDERNAADFTKSKILKSLLRIVTPKLHLKNIPMVMVAHVYETMEFIKKQVLSGGNALYLNPDNIFIMGKAQLKEKDENIGSTFSIRVEKSRFVKERSVIPIRVRWETGISKYSAMDDLATEFGIITEGKIGRSASYVYETIDGKTLEILQSRSDLEDEFWETIFKETDFAYKIEKKYSLPTPDSSNKESIIETDSSENIDDED